jgi:hypothetical protein
MIGFFVRSLQEMPEFLFSFQVQLLSLNLYGFDPGLEAGSRYSIMYIQPINLSSALGICFRVQDILRIFLSFFYN